jgi:transcriptional regulator with XRE-family HTH domain
MNLTSKHRLHAKLKNKAYRDAFVSARISQTIALQARVLRQKVGLSQQDLAKELGTSQNAVFRLENPQYGKHNISTLKKVASYFNVGLVVRFAPVSEIADWTLSLNPESMEIVDFDHDHGFDQREIRVVKVSDSAPAGEGVETREQSAAVAHRASMANVYDTSRTTQHSLRGSIANMVGNEGNDRADSPTRGSISNVLPSVRLYQVPIESDLIQLGR